MASSAGEMTIDLTIVGQPECCRLMSERGWRFWFCPETRFVEAEHPMGGRQTVVEVVQVGSRTDLEVREIGHAIAMLLNGGSQERDENPIEYVIQSGDGFLINADTFSMVSIGKDPAVSAMSARFYASHQEADGDLAKLEAAGFSGVLVPVYRGRIANTDEAAMDCSHCGQPMSRNPHPDAGRPKTLHLCGAVQVCIPCTVRTHHRVSSENRRHRRCLEDLVKAVRQHIKSLDTEMKMPSDPDRGKRIAALMNDLEFANDCAKRFGLVTK